MYKLVGLYLQCINSNVLFVYILHHHADRCLPHWRVVVALCVVFMVESSQLLWRGLLDAWKNYFWLLLKIGERAAHSLNQFFAVVFWEEIITCQCWILLGLLLRVLRQGLNGLIALPEFALWISKSSPASSSQALSRGHPVSSWLLRPVWILAIGLAIVVKIVEHEVEVRVDFLS